MQIKLNDKDGTHKIKDGIKLELNIRKTSSGDLIVREHPYVDIMISPSQYKIIVMPKEIVSDEVYDIQHDLLKFFQKNGAIIPDSIQGSNIYGSFEAKYPEEIDNFDPLKIVLLTLTKFMEREMPWIKAFKAAKEEEVESLTDPSHEESTELGEVPHEKIKGSMQYTYNPYTVGYRLEEGADEEVEEALSLDDLKKRAGVKSSGENPKSSGGNPFQNQVPEAAKFYGIARQISKSEGMTLEDVIGKIIRNNPYIISTFSKQGMSVGKVIQLAIDFSSRLRQGKMIKKAADKASTGKPEGPGLYKGAQELLQAMSKNPNVHRAFEKIARHYYVNNGNKDDDGKSMMPSDYVQKLLAISPEAGRSLGQALTPGNVYNLLKMFSTDVVNEQLLSDEALKKMVRETLFEKGVYKDIVEKNYRDQLYAEVNFNDLFEPED